jgi:general secretion pathway protein J
MSHREPQLGFTLLEVLIAVAIFAVVGTMAMTGYTQLAQQSERVEENMKRVRGIQLAVMRFTQDFSELEPRPVRDPLGSSSQPALLADGRSATLVELTRAGWSNPAATQRPTLQRAAYRLQDNKLYRDHWLVLDRTLATEPVRVELLDKVRSVRFRYMDMNRVWQESWPAQSLNNAGAAPTTGAPGMTERPLAVEVVIELEDWGTMTRLIEVPG